MIEIQSLVSTAVYGTPQRSTTGYNAKRLNMILAVLKKGRFQAWRQRRFPQHNRGISVDDPAIDLAVVAAILSSNEDIPVNKGFVLQEKWACLGNPSGKPSRPTHPKPKN
jgi:DNA repair protein RadA/Sms